MPAHHVKQGNVYRVVDPRGNILTNAQGHPVDGGGHPEEKHAVAQVQAINIHMHKARSHDSNNPHDRPDALGSDMRMDPAHDVDS